MDEKKNGCFNCAYFGVFKLNENPVSNAFWNVGNYLELSFCHLEALLFIVMGKIFAEYGTLKTKGNIYFIFNISIIYIVYSIPLVIIYSANTLVY